MNTHLVLMLLAFAAAPAVADEPAMRQGMHLQRDFDRIDSDHDGRLSWREFRNRVREVFFFQDLDSDGALPRAEATRGIARRFDALDADGDGELALKEFVDGHRAAFQDADRDGDGALSRSEVDALREGHRSRPRDVDD